MSRNAESAILSACFISEQAVSRVIEDLTIDDFTDQDHKDIFNCILNLFNRNDKIDIITVISEKDRQKYHVENLLINQISDIVLSDSNLTSHIKIVKEEKLKKNMKILVNNVNTQLNQDFNINETINFAREQLLSIDVNENKNDYNAMESVSLTIKETDKAIETNKPVGLSTYIKDVDSYIIMKAGNLITIAAKKGVGKTLLANQIGFENAFRGKKIVFFTMEMEVPELINRELSRRAKIDLSDINHGKFTNIEKYSFQAEVISRFDFIIDDTGKQSMSNIHSKLVKYKTKMKGLDLVIVDYIQLMKGGKGESRQQRLADISGNMKVLAKHFKVPVIILSQLNHDGITREAEDIENDSNIVLKLRRPFYEGVKSIKRNGIVLEPEEYYAQLWISKNRSGRTGKVNLYFDGAHQSFEGWTDEDE